MCGVVLPRLGVARLMTAAIPGVEGIDDDSKMVDPSMESAEVGISEVFPEITRVLQFDNSVKGSG